MNLGETTPSIGGPSFPWEAPNVYQHLMELRAAGRLREEDLEGLPDAEFLEKYGAEEYWLRTRAAQEDIASSAVTCGARAWSAVVRPRVG